MDKEQFSAEVFELLCTAGYNIVGVFTIPDDPNGQEDPLAAAARSRPDLKVFKWKSWRRKGTIKPEVLEQYKSVHANLNVMPVCTQFVPIEVIEAPRFKSICYHPSLLPRHRGASAISWTLVEGDQTAGFSIFWADEGLDTGPILLQRDCWVDPNENKESLNRRFLFPEGVKAMVEAVELIARGQAPKQPQPQDGATFDEYLNKAELCRLDLNQCSRRVHNFIRGLDRNPGAWIVVEGRTLKLYDSAIRSRSQIEDGLPLTDMLGTSAPGLVNKHGLYLPCSDHENMVQVKIIQEGNGELQEPARLFLQKTNPMVMEHLRCRWEASERDPTQMASILDQLFHMDIRESRIEEFSTFECFWSFFQQLGPEDKATICLSLDHLMSGHLCQGTGTEVKQVVNPWTGDTIGTFHSPSVDDVGKALDFATQALETIAMGQHGAAIEKLATKVEDLGEELASLLTAEQGILIHIARDRVAQCVGALRSQRSFSPSDSGSSHDSKTIRFVRHQSLGACVLVTDTFEPTLFQHIASALAHGNSLVILANDYFLAFHSLAKLCHKSSGLIADAVSVLMGVPWTDTTQKLIKEHRVAHVRQIQAKIDFHPVFILFQQPNLVKAMRHIKLLAGQHLQPVQVLVEAEYCDEILALLVESMGQITLGDPAISSTQCGPLPTQLELDLALDAISSKILSGRMQLIHGGRRLHEGQNLLVPTVLCDLKEQDFLKRPNLDCLVGPIVEVHRVCGDMSKASLRAILRHREVKALHVYTDNIQMGLRISECPNVRWCSINSLMIPTRQELEISEDSQYSKTQVVYLSYD
eukprot:snap_masked-scaffold56_size446035-processed-gene-3.11 protein:Tk11504 transcript:snap_masked-scaffold56_size446035-processed-gene-3.11-mRNA-1 annotation:"aldehyde dehydrogenase family 1 member l1"